MSKVERFTKEYFEEKKHHHRAAVKINDVMAEIDVKLYMIKQEDVLEMIRDRVGKDHSEANMSKGRIMGRKMTKAMMKYTQNKLSANDFPYLNKNGNDTYSRKALLWINGEEWIHPHVALTALQQYSVELSSEILEFLTMEKFFKERKESTSSYVELAIMMRQYHIGEGDNWDVANQKKTSVLVSANVAINSAIGIRSRNMPDISAEVHKVAEKFFSMLVIIFEDEKEITDGDIEMAKKLSGYKRIVNKYRKIEQEESENIYCSRR